MTSTPDSADAVASADPLAFMEKLSRSVYIYRPPKVAPTSSASSSVSLSSSSPSKAPKLVIIAAWMGARPAHIAKYLTPYRDGLLFGEAPADRPAILLLFCHQKDISSYARVAAVATTALPFIQDVLGNSLHASKSESSPAAVASLSPPPAPEVLVHTFSNGGCLVLGQIYNAIDPDHAQCLPAHVTLFDSCPGKFRYRGALAAFSMGIDRMPLAKRLVARPTIQVIVLYMLIRIRLERGLAWLVAQGRALLSRLFGVQPSPKPPGRSRALNTWTPHNVNTEFGGNRREVRRSYLYSSDDKIILSTDVEAHAAEAKGLGFTIATMAEFPGSVHVSHARTDGARYWQVVKDTWLGTKTGE